MTSAKVLAVAAAGMLLMVPGRTSFGAPAHPRAGRPEAVPLPVPVKVSPAGPARISNKELTAVVQRYCTTCHNDQLRTGNLSLSSFDVAAADERGEVAEKIIVKLRTEMMPPPGMPRPGPDTLLALVETLEETLDKAVDDDERSGSRLFQRLNRTEYQRAIRDLLGLEVNAADWLPPDSYLANFDNQSDAQTLSPMLLDGYMNAATQISRMAVGERDAVAAPKTYKVPIYASQHPWDHVEGTPYGTRGGLVVTHAFPADGGYEFELGLSSQGGEGARFEEIDLSIDGERVALMAVERGVSLRERVPGVITEPIFVRAGQHKVSAAFVRRTEGPYEDLMRPHDWSMAGRGSGSWGTTSLPHLEMIRIIGPHDPTAVSENESRRRIFSCHPTAPAEERACAAQIIGRLAAQAYRRPVDERDVQVLLDFYDRDGAKHGFEIGIRTALQAMLASPHFVFRLEREPANVKAGESYRIGDVELASRLSFFLWGTPPDEELMTLAQEGKLNRPRTLEQQTRRMLADPRSEALATRFAAQWLRLQDMGKVHPDAFWFPNFDQNVADAMRRETEMFFDNLVREDRSVLELFNADYTFVNERLARHYGMPNVVGAHFRRVRYPTPDRRGVLGQGSIQLLTSLGNRTSPVLRGKYVMEVLLGVDPPPPPPGIPALDETAGAKDGRLLTTRERMEMHRTAAMCRACHQYMDPIGLALDNFDVTGSWRIRENGMMLDTRGTFYDGTSISTPQDLTNVLLKRPIPLMRNVAKNLLAYAVGRPAQHQDMPTVRAITEAASKNDYRMSSFILGVVQSSPFRMKQAEASTDSNSGMQQR
jgi:hypothetical protein